MLIESIKIRLTKFTLSSSTTVLARTNLVKIIKQTDRYSQETKGITQGHQLRAITPTNWSCEALRSLLEKYNCISGFGDRTY